MSWDRIHKIYEKISEIFSIENVHENENIDRGIEIKKLFNKQQIVLIIILVFALFLRLYFFVGPNLNDDIDYISSAYMVSNGNLQPLYGNSINAIRSMITIPVALSFKLFGVNVLSASLYPLLCSLITITATFYIGKILVNEHLGLLSAAILSFFPVDIAFSTQLVPTIPVTMFMTLSIALFLYAGNNDNRVLFFLSGVMAGFSYLANIMTFIIIFSIALSYLIIERKIKKEYFIVIAGFLLIFSMECFFMFLNTGDLLHRLDVIHETEKMIGTNTAMDYYPRVMLRAINVDFNAHEGNLGIYVHLFFIGSMFSLFIKPEKQLWFLILSFFLIMSYLQFGVMTSTFKPIAKWVRYLIVFGPTFSLVIAYMFEKLTKVDYFKAIFIIILFVVTLPYLIGTTGAYRSWTYDFKEEYNYLRNLPEKTIYTDQVSSGFLRFYFSFKRDIRNLEFARFEMIRDSYVVINGSRGVVENAEMRKRLPEFARNPPDNWKLLTTLEGEVIRPKIYYVE